MVPLLITTFLLEKKVYHEDSSLEEIEAIKSRVYLLEEGIIVYKELELMSEFSVNTMFDQLELLIRESSNQAVLLDLSETQAPSFKIRQLLYQRFELISNSVKIFSYNTGKNGFINIALKFFMNSTQAPSKNSIFSSTFETALKKIYDKLNR